MDEVLKAGFNKNKSYFKNKEINGRTITDVDFNGNVINLYTSPKTSDDPEKETFETFNLNRQEELETFIDKLVVSQYGGDDSAEDVKDAIKILLDERKSSRPMSATEEDIAWITKWKNNNPGTDETTCHRNRCQSSTGVLQKITKIKLNDFRRIY